MSQSHPIWSPGFWRGYWITLRPYLFFVSGVSGLVGLALAPRFEGVPFAAAFLAFFFSYGLGQALTDTFQTDTDSISSPYRPLTQGLLRRRDVVAVSLAGLGGCSAVFLILNPWTVLLCAASVVGLATYTPLKRRWWGGPPWNSWIVALLPAIGILCATRGLSGFSRPGLGWFMVSVFFSYAIFVLLGYFKDISADRATGYRTLPVVFGRRVSVAASGACTLAAGIASALGLASTGFWSRRSGAAAGFALLLWVAGLLVLALAHAWILHARSERETHGPIAHSVRGYLLLHLGEAVALRPSLALFGLALYALFELALATRPERSQV